MVGQLTSVTAIFNIDATIKFQSDNGMHAWVGVLLNDHYQQIGEVIEKVGYSSIKWLALPSLFFSILITALLIQLFRLYFKGAIFAAQNTQCIRWIGLAVIAKVIIGIFYPPLLLVYLDYMYPAENIVKILRINETDIATFIIGCIISVIGHVMAIGQALNEEQELTI